MASRDTVEPESHLVFDGVDEQRRHQVVAKTAAHPRAHALPPRRSFPPSTPTAASEPKVRHCGHEVMFPFPSPSYLMSSDTVPSTLPPRPSGDNEQEVEEVSSGDSEQEVEELNRGALISSFEDFSAKLNKMAECGLQQEEEEEDFLPDFKEYMKERELKYSRFDISDHYYVDSIPDACASLKVRQNSIRHALLNMMFYPELRACLVQFWAPTKTSEGRTLLTTQFQPFAIGTTDEYPSGKHKLCEYRMGMYREYNNFFYADAESVEEQLGLPGRVFLNKLPESTPGVEHYTLKEYPQSDLALDCGICGSWALPVFEHSSDTCVGVLEIVCTDDVSDLRYNREFLGRMYDIFQGFGLRCFDGYIVYKHCKIQYGDKNKALTAAFQELNMVYESVCKIHDLPLALTWVSCRSCNNGLLQSQFQFPVLDYCDEENYDKCSFGNFIEVSKVCHLRKGQVTGRILLFPNLLYCSDVKQFSIAEFPLVPYARYWELGGWFTMCLQSSYTGDQLYVLEFFLPASNKNDENILTRLSLILGTMEEYFETFKLASGQGLGEALSVELIDFQNGQKSHSIQMILATRCIPGLELLKDREVMLQLGQLEQPSMDVINNRMDAINNSEAQKYNLTSLDSLQNGKVTTQLDSSDQPSMDPSSNGQNVITAERNILVVSSSKEGKRKMQDREHKKAGVRIEISKEEILKCAKMRREDAAKELKASASVAHIKPSFEDVDMMTIRATCENNTIKFRLSLSSRLVEMQQEVAKRLNLEGGTYYIKYKDEEDVLIVIACDEDLQDCLHSSRSLGISSIAVLLELKQPITNLNPDFFLISDFSKYMERGHKYSQLEISENSHEEEDFLPDFKKVFSDFSKFMKREHKYSQLEISENSHDEEDFLPDFKEYMERELKYSRLETYKPDPGYQPAGRYREYNNFFYADAESREEQLGLPGRVFHNKFPESTPEVKCYSRKEYPQRDLALRCEIRGSWALPVFEQSSHTCIGEFGLRCFDGHKHCKMQYRDDNKALTTAFEELNMVFEYVCEVLNLPLGLTWVSCRSFNDLLQSQFQFTIGSHCEDDCDTMNLDYFAQVSKVCLLKKGQVAGRILPFPNLLYCSDIKQFSIAESPLVPHARWCELGGWFTICLQSSYTGDELYVVEFFLPKRVKNDEKILTKLGAILRLMDNHFKTFKLASGQGLGEALSVEVIDFQYGQRSHSIQMIPARKFIPSLELVQDEEAMLQQVQQDQPSMDAINNEMYVVSETQNYNFPCLDSFKNGKVTTQLDSSDQPSMDPSSNGQNVVTAERNILVVPNSKERKRKVQDREHKKAGVRIEVSLEEILKCSNMKREDAARELKVGVSTFKRVCRGYDIHRWPPRNIENANSFRPLPVENQRQIPQLNSDLPSYQALAGVSHIKLGFQDANMVTIRAKYENNKIKFRLPLSSRFVELQQEVAKRLNLETGTYYVKYKDEEDEEDGLTLIACDEDLQDCMHTSRNDCGVYMMAYMISLAVGDKLPQFSQAQAKRMRRTICLELKKWDIIPQCPLVDYNFLYIQELHGEGTGEDKINKEYMECMERENKEYKRKFKECKEEYMESVEREHKEFMESVESMERNFKECMECVEREYKEFMESVEREHKEYMECKEKKHKEYMECKEREHKEYMERQLKEYMEWEFEYFFPDVNFREYMERELKYSRLELSDNHSEFGLRCFDGYKHCKIQDGDKNKALTTAFQELNMDGGVMLHKVQQDQPSMDAINNGMYFVSETQNYSFPCLDSLKNGKVTTQLDSSDQPSMDPSSNGQNVVTAERNILVVPSSKERKRKMQDRKHKKAGVRIEVSLEEILKCLNMKREDAVRELKVFGFCHNVDIKEIKQEKWEMVPNVEIGEVQQAAVQAQVVLLVWLDAHFSYTPTIDEEETINK
ncbi:hypothetical protein RHGRI_006044 [Rhododendron griersonianum]|uniref:PB1 domain-containing protein n=1 Tax=Rhododendron griersonianum TaxID=479676 RepID=A0AAV6LEU6_9ERIC|nr:hypothetical protein RHGRI_006044 [Rhododendron griersonianum]